MCILCNGPEAQKILEGCRSEVPGKWVGGKLSPHDKSAPLSCSLAVLWPCFLCVFPFYIVHHPFCHLFHCTITFAQSFIPSFASLLSQYYLFCYSRSFKYSVIWFSCVTTFYLFCCRFPDIFIVSSPISSRSSLCAPPPQIFMTWFITLRNYH